PANTSELICCSATDVRLRSPTAFTLVFVSVADTAVRTAVSSGVQPMKFRATATPIETPTPAPLPKPTPTAMDAATTTDEMVELLEPARRTSPALWRALFWPNAFTLVRITFCATAPAPATAMPANSPTPTARDAATDTALIVLRETPIRPVMV